MIVTVRARREFVLPDIRLTGNGMQDLEEIDRLTWFRNEVFSTFVVPLIVRGDEQLVEMSRHTHWIGLTWRQG